MSSSFFLHLSKKNKDIEIFKKKIYWKEKNKKKPDFVLFFMLHVVGTSETLNKRSRSKVSVISKLILFSIYIETKIKYTRIDHEYPPTKDRIKKWKSKKNRKYTDYFCPAFSTNW